MLVKLDLLDFLLRLVHGLHGVGISLLKGFDTLLQPGLLFHHVLAEGVLGPEEQSPTRRYHERFVAFAPDLLDTFRLEQTLVLLEEQFSHLLEVEVVGHLAVEYLSECQEGVVFVEYEHMLVSTGHLFATLRQRYRLLLVHVGHFPRQRHCHRHVALRLDVHNRVVFVRFHYFDHFVFEGGGIGLTVTEVGVGHLEVDGNHEQFPLILIETIFVGHQVLEVDYVLRLLLYLGELVECGQGRTFVAAFLLNVLLVVLQELLIDGLHLFYGKLVDLD